MAQDLVAQAFAALQAAAAGQGPLLGVLFLAGLVGGISHCLAMCGPFVLAQVSARLDRVPAAAMSELSRLRGAALLPYHFGRMTTYAALGALAAVLTGELVRFSGFQWLAAALLVVAAAVFLSQGLSRGAGLLPALGGGIGSGGGLGEALAGMARPLLDGGERGPRGYLLGVVLGFLPCGLLYGALAAAASAGSAAGGALAMVSFTLGTVPGLVGAGAAGHFMMRRGGNLVKVLGAALMIFNAGTLGYLAWRIVA